MQFIENIPLSTIGSAFPVPATADFELHLIARNYTKCPMIIANFPTTQ